MSNHSVGVEELSPNDKPKFRKKIQYKKNGFRKKDISVQFIQFTSK